MKYRLKIITLILFSYFGLICYNLYKSAQDTIQRQEVLFQYIAKQNKIREKFCQNYTITPSAFVHCQNIFPNPSYKEFAGFFNLIMVEKEGFCKKLYEDDSYPNATVDEN